MGKDYLKKYWSFQRVERIPFLPLVCSLAAKIQGISVQSMFTNATKMAIALQKAQNLFHYDAVFNIVDSTVEAEACGCELHWSGENEIPSISSQAISKVKNIEDLGRLTFEASGRIPIVLDVTKRLRMVLGNRISIVGTLTGPVCLSGHLEGESFMEHMNNGASSASRILAYANSVIIDLCKWYGETKLDGILVNDPSISCLRAEAIELIKPLYRTLYNVASFYGMRIIIFVGGPSAEMVELVFDLDADGFIVSGSTLTEVTVALAARKRKHLGYGIPPSVLTGPKSGLPERIPLPLFKGRTGLFLSTDGPVPYETPIENIHGVMEMLRTA